jgi:hypothetical protein
MQKSVCKLTSNTAFSEHHGFGHLKDNVTSSRALYQANSVWGNRV